MAAHRRKVNVWLTPEQFAAVRSAANISGASYGDVVLAEAAAGLQALQDDRPAEDIRQRYQPREPAPGSWRSDKRSAG